MSESQEKAYRLRIPEDLYAEVEKIAEAEDRSVNGQIVSFLRDAVRRWNARQARKAADEGYTTEDIEESDLVAA
jgi:hypothetical protein